MDFGYPQYTEARILSEFIKTDAYRMEVTQRPPMAVTNAVSWRSEGIRYKKNEVRLFLSLAFSLSGDKKGLLAQYLWRSWIKVLVFSRSSWMWWRMLTY